MIKRILLLDIDKDNSFISYKLRKKGFICDEKNVNFLKKINYAHMYDGIIIRNLKISKKFIEKAINLKFIARIGSGTENIDKKFICKRKIKIISTPEGNKDSVAEHAIGMLLCIMNRIIYSYQDILKKKWNRKYNIGIEMMGKTVGIIGYGNVGKSFAKKLSGFDVKVICYDILNNIGDKYAKQVDINTIFEESDIVSLHVSYNKTTKGMINYEFIKKFHKPFYLINTSRGGCLIINHLVMGLKYNKINGACLDVLEYENLYFSNIFHNKISKDFFYLINSKKVIITPHIAGLTKESKYKMGKKIIEKINSFYKKLINKKNYK